jgi:hypothetical protein
MRDLVRESESEERAQRQQSRDPGRPPHQTRHGLTSTIEDAASADDPAILNHFHPPRVGTQARGTSAEVAGLTTSATRCRVCVH